MRRLAGKAILIITTMLPALVFVLSGCATTPPGSGFLSDYSKLHEDKYGDRSLRWYEKENFNWHQYRKIMLDPIVVYYHPEAKYRQIDPEAVKKLTDYFRKVVEEELGDEYPIVTAPGPDVLRIRAAITEIVPANPAINLVTTTAVFVPLDMGGAAIESEFLDSQTNEVMAAMVDKKMGNPLDPRFYRGFTTMGYAKGAFQAWVGELKKALKSNP
jgi:hypothetical protein